MKQNFNDCLTRLLKDEGGYCNDPGDNGGPTKYGITIIDVRKYVKKGATAEDVKALTVDQAEDIYRSKYWDALGCDDLPSGVDYSCFDYGVNSGLGRPRKALQRFNSLQGIQLIDAINDERTAFLQAIGKGHNAGFLKGWMARVGRVRSYSKVLYNKKDTSSGPVGAGATVGIFGVLSQYFHQHEYLIIGGGIALAVLIGTAIHLYKNRTK